MPPRSIDTVLIDPSIAKVVPIAAIVNLVQISRHPFWSTLPFRCNVRGGFRLRVFPIPLFGEAPAAGWRFSKRLPVRSRDAANGRGLSAVWREPTDPTLQDYIRFPVVELTHEQIHELGRHVVKLLDDRFSDIRLFTDIGTRVQQ